MNNLDKDIIKYCPSCKLLSVFEYLGEQKITKEKTQGLYTCKKCETTLSLDYITGYDAMRRTQNHQRGARH